MSVDPKFKALVKPLNQQVFSFVVRQRQVHMKDLLDSLSASTSKEVVVESLSELERAGLIKEESASIEDFNTYYVTAEGLQADRQFRRAFA